MTPSAFIFLYENQLFLTFRNRTVAVWNFRGELVTSFEDHLLWHPDCNTNNIYITSDQDLIISYCKADSDDSLSEGSGTFPILFLLSLCNNAPCVRQLKNFVFKLQLISPDLKFDVGPFWINFCHVGFSIKICIWFLTNEKHLKVCRLVMKKEYESF